jgi:hypothetical protein
MIAEDMTDLRETRDALGGDVVDKIPSKTWGRKAARAHAAVAERQGRGAGTLHGAARRVII